MPSHRAGLGAAQPGDATAPAAAPCALFRAAQRRHRGCGCANAPAAAQRRMPVGTAPFLVWQFPLEDAICQGKQLASDIDRAAQDLCISSIPPAHAPEADEVQCQQTLLALPRGQQSALAQQPPLCC